MRHRHERGKVETQSPYRPFPFLEPVCSHLFTNPSKQSSIYFSCTEFFPRCCSPISLRLFPSIPRALSKVSCMLLGQSRDDLGSTSQIILIFRALWIRLFPHEDVHPHCSSPHPPPWPAPPLCSDLPSWHAVARW